MPWANCYVPLGDKLQGVYRSDCSYSEWIGDRIGVEEFEREIHSKAVFSWAPLTPEEAGVISVGIEMKNAEGAVFKEEKKPAMSADAQVSIDIEPMLKEDTSSVRLTLNSEKLGELGKIDLSPEDIRKPLQPPL